MRPGRVLLGFFLLALLAAGCAADDRAAYSGADLALTFAGQGPIAVGVRDARPEVARGDRRETFIGFQRSLYGIPFAQQTRSGKPFAQELAEAIARGLRARGAQVRTVALSPFRPREEAVSALTSAGAPRALLFEPSEWYADTYVRTTLHYALRLTVLDAQGRELARSEAAGEDDLGARQRPERRSLQAATQDIVQTLLSSREGSAALASVSAAR